MVLVIFAYLVFVLVVVILGLEIFLVLGLLVQAIGEICFLGGCEDGVGGSSFILWSCYHLVEDLFNLARGIYVDWIDLEIS